MKRLLLPLLVCMLILAACGQNDNQSSEKETKAFNLKTAKGEEKSIFRKTQNELLSWHRRMRVV